ncbi:MAG: ribonuclease E/G, partial [Chitinophagales bacterium]
DILNESFNENILNDNGLAQDIRNYIKTIAPGKEKIVTAYHNSKPVFDAYGVTRQIKSLFGRTVNLESGAYLIIEHTEALHVIDVNSGNKTAVKGDQEQNALSANLEAAREIARQLRLRDLGGIIVIDFIDMRHPENKKKVYNELKDAMATDRAKHTILPISKFGVGQVTRQRVRPELNIATHEVCPTCNGSGKIEASILILEEIERKVKHLILQQNQKSITLTTHPYLEAYIKRGRFFNSLQWKWYRRFKRWIKVNGSDDYQLVEYRFFDNNEEEIIAN